MITAHYETIKGKQTSIIPVLDYYEVAYDEDSECVETYLQAQMWIVNKLVKDKLIQEEDIGKYLC